MNFSQSFRLAVKSLLASKMRALLTMLGIIIGVAAVIIITSLGNGMQNYMNAQFDQLGANLIQVQIWGLGGGMSSRSVDPDDMYALVDKYPQYLSGVSPYVSTQALVRHGSDEYERTSIYGVSEFFYDAGRNQVLSGSKLGEGRFLSYVDVERYQNVCVIGSYLAKDAFGGDALGRTITISGTPFTIIGVNTALDSGYHNAFLAVFVGVMTGVGGGMLRDIMVRRTPLVLRREIYAVAAIPGALIYYYLQVFLPKTLCMLLCAAMIVVLRLASIRFHWNLPNSVEAGKSVPT